MGRRPWTTHKQRVWLNERRRAYIEAQERKLLPVFYKDVTADFFQAFELKVCSAAESQAGERMGLYDGDGEDWSENEDVCYAPSERLARDIST